MIRFRPPSGQMRTLDVGRPFAVWRARWPRPLTPWPRPRCPLQRVKVKGASVLTRLIDPALSWGEGGEKCGLLMSGEGGGWKLLARAMLGGWSPTKGDVEERGLTRIPNRPGVGDQRSGI